MTPKNTAKRLIKNYWSAKVETPHVRESIMSKELAIKCALISIDEILTLTIEKDNIYYYYLEVKKELEKL